MSLSSLESVMAKLESMPQAPSPGPVGTTDSERAAIGEVTRIFNEDLPKVFPGWESRKQQVDMAEKIALAFERGVSILAEAGTGTGKSLALLANAVEFSKREGKPVIISTGTHVLQEQYATKDVPTLQRATGGFKAVVAKGKGNYLCKLRLSHEEQDLLNDRVEEISEWANTTETGDRSELPAHLAPIWSAVNVNDSCIKSACPFFSGCHYYRARRDMAGANIIIVNHALLMMDVVVRRNSFENASLLPDPAAIIIDEAHHLEAVARQTLGTSIAQTRLPSIIHDALGVVPGLDRVQTDQALRIHNQMFTQVFTETSGERVEFVPSETVIGLTNGLRVSLGEVVSLLNAERRRANSEEKRSSIDSMVGRINQYKRDVESVIEPDKDHAAWAETVQRPNGIRTTIHSTPIEPGSTLRHEIFGRAPIVCSSATLTTNRAFGYYRSQVGAPEDAMEFVADSPFDYQRNSLLYVPRQTADPRSDTYHSDIAGEVLQIILAAKGRTFVLCTSYRGMNELHATLARELVKHGIRYMKQGDMAHTQLIEEFKRDENSVLFATSSFWEGVDVQGDALSCVIIDKLPFAVPTDPITRAKMNAIEERGGNAFMDYSLPEAVLRMRQGFGRLIRSQDDRGVVAVLDRRIIVSRYGRIFLNSLPEAKMVRDIKHVQQFFEEGK